MIADSTAFPLGARLHLRDVVYQAVRERALEARDETASYLREVDLARALGVSRTPVREALSRLAHEGIVELEPRRGARLVPSTLEDYVRWCELREVLEGQAARLASERADDDDLKGLGGLLAAFDTRRASAEPAAYAQANAAFHAAIFDAARNPILTRARRHVRAPRPGAAGPHRAAGPQRRLARRAPQGPRTPSRRGTATPPRVRPVRMCARCETRPRARLHEADFEPAPQIKSPPVPAQRGRNGPHLESTSVREDTMNTLFKTTLLGAAATAFLAVPHGQAAEEIDLTVIAGPSADDRGRSSSSSPISIPTVEERLKERGDNYRINWNQGWAGTIAKPDGVLEAVEQGLGDVGLVPVLFDAAKLPLENITYMLPFTTDDLSVVIDTVNRMHDDIPAMNEMWGRYNQRFLAAGGLDTLSHHHDVPARQRRRPPGPQDRRARTGRELDQRHRRGAGRWHAQHLLQRHEDRRLRRRHHLRSRRAAPSSCTRVAPYFTEIGVGAQYANAMTVNEDVWEGLPEEVREVFAETAKGWSQAVTDVTAGRQKKSFDTMKAGGATFSTLDPEERKRWAGMIDNVAKDWAADLESRGIPAGEAMTYYMDALRESGAPLAREWDKE